jgi:pimeloyl-ACP methyl ester carboxylesterase
MSLELVSVQTKDGVRLDGTWRRSEAGRASTLGIDAVILHHGVGGNFYGASLFEPIAQELLAEGCAVLRVNNRGHDLMYNSPNGRLGAAFEVVDDCKHDWRAWLDFAESQGCRNVALWGHSLGALKTIYFLAMEGDTRVSWAIATSPPLFSYHDYVTKAGAERFQNFYGQAKRLLEIGEPDGLLTVNIPTNVVVAAKTYIDKYGEAERYNMLDHLPNVPVPIFVTIGSEEGLGPEKPDWFPFGGFAAKVSALAETVPNLTFSLIEGANHAYTGKSAALWSTARLWIDRVGVPAKRT